MADRYIGSIPAKNKANTKAIAKAISTCLAGLGYKVRDGIITWWIHEHGIFVKYRGEFMLVQQQGVHTIARISTSDPDMFNKLTRAIKTHIDECKKSNNSKNA